MPSSDPVNGFEAVVFDIGGVVTESPLHAIARYERDHAIEANAINRAVVTSGEQGAWSSLERGEMTFAAFCALFEVECRACGVEVSAQSLMKYIAEASRPRPRMLEAIRRLRDHGLHVGALTNNWLKEGPDAQPHPLREHFEIVIESSVVGMRKPDPRIYALVCRELGVEPARAVFLDDIGRNLKTARALGMATIKVDDPDAALRELSALLAIDLSS